MNTQIYESVASLGTGLSSPFFFETPSRCAYCLLLAHLEIGIVNSQCQRNSRTPTLYSPGSSGYLLPRELIASGHSQWTSLHPLLPDPAGGCRGGCPLDMPGDSSLDPLPTLASPLQAFPRQSPFLLVAACWPFLLDHKGLCRQTLCAVCQHGGPGTQSG